MTFKNQPKFIGKEILHFSKLNSTNTYIKENISSIKNGTAVVTDYQFSGKGRLGRVWNVPKNTALTFSFVLKNPDCNISLFPLLCAVAINRSLNEFLKIHSLNACVQIKWPNDIIINQKKLCGVLCESIINQNQINVICGIGLNINQSIDYFKENNLPFGSSLAIEFQKDFQKDELFKIILSHLNTVFALYIDKGFDQFKAEYSQNLVNVGNEVSIIYNTKTINAICLGINEQGNLVCNHDGSIINVNSGEASVRGIYGYV